MPDATVQTSLRSPTSDPPRRWRSLAELERDPQWLAQVVNEFAPGASEWLDSASRRRFLKLMGASLAMAGVVGCSDFPDEKIAPYVNPPESVLAGVPNSYATTFPFNGYGVGVLASSYEGRPTKIEGNPDHPGSLGGSHVFAQASVLDLYDPDRSRDVTDAGNDTTWSAFWAAWDAHLARHDDGGAGLRLLTRTITSPTLAAQLAAFGRRFPRARRHVHDPAAHAGCGARNGGATGEAIYDFSKAGVIVSLDADFLTSDPGSLAYARQFADGRRRQPGLDPAQQNMNRLYVAESAFTITGSMADHRLSVRPGDVLGLARAIAGRLGVAAGRSAAEPPGAQAFADAIAADLRQAGVVVAGDHLPAEVQSLAQAINQAIGAVGSRVRYIEPVAVGDGHPLGALVDDMAAGKVHTLLIVGGNPAYDCPADVPFADALKRLSTAQDADGRRACLTASLAAHDNETSFLCQWQLPESHYLESWGDARAYDGTASIIQPLIMPLSGASRSFCQVLETITTGRMLTGYQIVREQWRSMRKIADDAAFDQWWQQTLGKGVVDGSAHRDAAAAPPPPAAIASPAAEPVGDWDLIFRPDASVWDGQFANNPWLQETPRPFTKLVWDNAALIGYRSAQKLGLRDGSVLRIARGGATVDAPVMIVPGHPEQTLTLPLGYGRTRGGHVINEGRTLVRGFNACRLQPSATPGYASDAKVAVLKGEHRDLVTTRSHHAMAALPGLNAPTESGPLRPDAIEHPGMSDEQIEVHSRRLVRSATLAEFRADPDWVTKLGGEVAAREKGTSADSPGRRVHLTLYPVGADAGGWDYSRGHQWAMSIDQNTCIGCNACLVACQAENNIPVVGKEQVALQREMHWIRIDDWFGARPGGEEADAVDNPQVIHMPVPCQHCENAPCEVVCPVGATTHSAEGLNEMTYNRCVGTRYCSNNCPYKVRRFNFLLYSDYQTPSRALQFNPDVTVRSRGVMEKCTYCVQRLNRTRMNIEKLTVRLEERAAKVASQSPEKAAALRQELTRRQRQLLDDLQTACQQACPTRAIAFGDKNVPDHLINKLKEDNLTYTLLDDLTTQPRTSYMARLSNVNGKM